MQVLNGRSVKWALAATMAALMSVSVQAQTLKVVMHSDVKILDPIWTTAYIVRNHGYMIYDTLFAVDDKLAVKPQMVEAMQSSDVTDWPSWNFSPSRRVKV